MSDQRVLASSYTCRLPLFLPPLTEPYPHWVHALNCVCQFDLLATFYHLIKYSEAEKMSVNEKKIKLKEKNQILKTSHHIRCEQDNCETFQESS